jgi:hypothetical protein
MDDAKQDRILLKIYKELKQIRSILSSESRLIVTTPEAARILDVDARSLSAFHKEGMLPSRYGAQKSGYKYSRAEVLTLQQMLLTGQVRLPSRKK